jgi:hypothetical protein
MVEKLVWVLLFVAFLAVSLEAFGVQSNRVKLGWLGVALYILVALIR